VAFGNSTGVKLRYLFLLLAAAGAFADSPIVSGPELDLPALGDSLRNLKSEEQRIFDEAAQLIQRKEHSLAFLTLSRLVENNPKNSAFRVIRAYAALQLGNLVGALGDARVAEAARPHQPYRCWFLAKVAFLAGDGALTRREIGHVAKHPVYGPQAAELRKQLRK